MTFACSGGPVAPRGGPAGAAPRCASTVADASGRTAAEAIAMNGRNLFDLYILDIWLPGMDGVELCRRLREQGVTKPIMFFSAMGVQEKDKDYVLGAGANEFLVKSVDLDRFTETVERLLKESREASA